MKAEARWSRCALDDLRRLDSAIADRVTRKVMWFCAQRRPLEFAKMLTGSFDSLYRFRIGDYRVFFEVKNGEMTILLILRVKHRREAYR